MGDALSAIGRSSDEAGGWNCIISWVEQVERICQTAATGWRCATDAIMQFMLSESQDTEISQGEHCLPRRKRKMES
jgi:hypothetical protein